MEQSRKGKKTIIVLTALCVLLAAGCGVLGWRAFAGFRPVAPDEVYLVEMEYKNDFYPQEVRLRIEDFESIVLLTAAERAMYENDGYMRNNILSSPWHATLVYHCNDGSRVTRSYESRTTEHELTKLLRLIPEFDAAVRDWMI